MRTQHQVEVDSPEAKALLGLLSLGIAWDGLRAVVVTAETLRPVYEGKDWAAPPGIFIHIEDFNVLVFTCEDPVKLAAFIAEGKRT